MNSYNWDEESQTLQVSRCNCKSKVQVQAAIDAGLSQTKIDGFIALYLPTLDPTHKQADDWYEQHLLVQSLPQDAERATVTTTDDNGDEVITELPTAYENALQARSEAEVANPWLAGLRGETAPDRPVFTPDPSIANGFLREAFKANREAVISKLTVTVDGMVFDADTASVSGMVTRMGTMNTGDSKLWVLADNTPAMVTYEQFLEAATLGSDQITDKWVMS